MFIVKKVHQSVSDRSRQVVPPLEHPKVVTSSHNVDTTFFLFSKCLSWLTHSHNASAVSLIFFCDSEYDQSLVPRSRFLLGHYKERPDICAWQKGTPEDEIETRLSDSYVCWSNVVSVWPWEKACFFLSSVPCLGKGTVLLCACTRCLQDSVLILRCTLIPLNFLSLGFLTSTSWYVSHCPTTDLVKIFSPCRH